MEERESCLVTGAGGFIGSHLTETLVTLGYPVKAMVRYRSDGSVGFLEELRQARPSNLEIIRADVTDNKLMRRILEDVDWVFNLAALIGIPYSFEAPESYVQTNLVGTLNLLEGALESGVSAFIQTSTSEVYGSAVQTPMAESHRLHPQSPYAASKVAADALALSYFHSFDLPVGVVRPFNTFGPRQSLRAVIPTIISQLAEDTLPVVRLGNLEAKRDFTFVQDTVDGFIAFAKHISQVKGQAVNLGAGWSISVGEVLEKSARIMGRDYRLEIQKDRLRPHSSEVTELLSDNSQARKLLSWEPVRSTAENFEQSLESTIKWYVQDLEKVVKVDPSEYAK